MKIRKQLKESWQGPIEEVFFPFLNKLNFNHIGNSKRL